MYHVNVAIPYLTLPYQSWKRHESVAMSNASNYPFFMEHQGYWCVDKIQACSIYSLHGS